MTQVHKSYKGRWEDVDFSPGEKESHWEILSKIIIQIISCVKEKRNLQVDRAPDLSPMQSTKNLEQVL
jgi:hypothetical protein